MPMPLLPAPGDLIFGTSSSSSWCSARSLRWSFLVPKASVMGSFIGTSGLSSAFASVVGRLVLLDFFQLGYGVPLMISAGVSCSDSALAVHRVMS